MDLKDIAAVSGKGGLFKIVKPTRTGVILESIDAEKSKLITNASNRISILKEISVYTTSKDASLPLEDVFRAMFQKFGAKINVSSKSSDQELRNTLEQVVPDYDKERVYISDIKKIVTWYSILADNFPDIFEKSKEEVKAVSSEKEEKPEPSEKKAAKKVAKKETSKKEGNEEEKPKAKTAAKKK